MCAEDIRLRIQFPHSSSADRYGVHAERIRKGVHIPLIADQISAIALMNEILEAREALPRLSPTRL